MSLAIELVALDLDGTLLGKDGRVSQRNAAAIALARAQGVEVILATGKTRDSAVQVIEELRLDAPGVFLQGLLICAADGAVLREVVFEPALAAAVLRYAEEEGLPHFVYGRGGLFAPVQEHYGNLSRTKYGEPQPQVIGPLAKHTETLAVHKIIFGDPTGDGKLRRRVEQRFGDRLAVTQAVPEYVELFAQGSSKGEGVAWLIGQMGIAPEAMLAVGDGDNDLEMLRMAGIGVAMGNARPSVKASADFVVRSNEEAGVAEALERFVLCPQPVGRV